jgi:hypothetical protein
VIYASDYPLQEIQCVKTVVSPHYWSRIISSLVIVLRNNEEEIVDTIRQGRHRRLTFYIDIHANTQAKMGKEIAEFLGIPYQDSVYTSSCNGPQSKQVRTAIKSISGPDSLQLKGAWDHIVCN